MNQGPEKEKDPYQRQEKRNVFHPESGLMGFLTKLGEIILLNIVWILCCLPVVTIGASTAAMYYSMVKCIRRNRSTPIKEFWSAFKRNLLSGILMTIGFGGMLFLLWYLQGLAPVVDTVDGRVLTDQGKMLTGVYIGFAIIIVAILIYLFPVLSRFSMKISGMIKLAFVMSIRFFYFTLLIMIVTAAIGVVQFFFLPITLVLIWPSLWCFATTFMIEKAMKKYMPPPEDDGEDHWYWE